MFTEFNYSVIDEEIIQMYMIPSQMRIDEARELADGEEERQRNGRALKAVAPEDYKLNFTWNITHFEDDTLEVFLLYEHPLEISRFED